MNMDADVFFEPEFTNEWEEVAKPISMYGSWKPAFNWVWEYNLQAGYDEYLKERWATWFEWEALKGAEGDFEKKVCVDYDVVLSAACEDFDWADRYINSCMEQQGITDAMSTTQITNAIKNGKMTEELKDVMNLIYWNVDLREEFYKYNLSWRKAGGDMSLIQLLMFIPSYVSQEMNLKWLKEWEHETLLDFCEKLWEREVATLSTRISVLVQFKPLKVSLWHLD